MKMILPVMLTLFGSAAAWKAEWELSRVTSFYGTNGSGYLDADYANFYGVIGVDWGNARAVWQKGNPQTFKGEEALVTQANMFKSTNPNVRVLIYRNTELALGWMVTQRNVMADPKYSNYFLKYPTPLTEPPNCVERSTAHDGIYCETEGGGGGSQYFWDYRNEEVQDFFVNNISMGPTAGMLDVADGLFMDDDQGLPEEHPHVQPRLNLTQSEMNALHVGAVAAYNKTLDRLQSLGKITWQELMRQQISLPKNTSSPEDCSAIMRSFCSKQHSPGIYWIQADVQQSTLVENIAMFLVGRGPNAILAFNSWGNQQIRPPKDPILQTVNGVPTSDCSEFEPQSFRRSWSRGEAVFHCSNFTGELHF
eukprot:TRINITY_DN20127_c0_g1_i1.p1 TRINITY_DN20127_c0_g1~~TRINITY_DN20127_c0_g1_i1.p1  ORF type:complete len:365 (+),score=53.45 TRINITY_DN20127_c0_g1_i1:1034-2128(+)